MTGTFSQVGNVNGLLMMPGSDRPDLSSRCRSRPGSRTGLRPDLLDQPLHFPQPNSGPRAASMGVSWTSQHIPLRIERPGAHDRPTQVDSDDDPVHQPFTALIEIKPRLTYDDMQHPIMCTLFKKTV
jgi:hypothetical protein